jgi:ParB family chromosome partitioning protein
LNELSQSIREKGMLQPVIIRRDEQGNIFLVAGERRLRAAKKSGLVEIPAILTNDNPAEIALIENLQRENLKPIEEAEALHRMIEEYDYTQEQLARVIGKGRTTITETLSLNKLPEEIKTECRRADIFPRGLLVEISKLDSPKKMLRLFEKVKRENLKSDQVRDLARNKRKRRSSAEMGLQRINDLKAFLEKTDLENAEKAEKTTLMEGLQDLRTVIDKILRE